MNSYALLFCFFAINFGNSSLFAAGSVPSNMASLPFQTVEKGQNSAIEDALAKVYRTKQDFEAFWGRHGSNNDPSPDIPDVDFATRMVIAVYWGTQNSGGYSIEITSVDEGEEGGDTIVVNYVKSSPAPGGMVTMALTQPYHVISLDASDKEVVFEGSEKPPDPPSSLQKLMLSFHKGADTDAIVAQIEALPHVTKVNMMSSIKILFVDFDTEKMGKDEAMKLLEDIDGVKYVEEDR